jgi:hypothetical protein
VFVREAEVFLPDNWGGTATEAYTSAPPPLEVLTESGPPSAAPTCACAATPWTARSTARSLTAAPDARGLRGRRVRPAPRAVGRPLGRRAAPGAEGPGNDPAVIAAWKAKVSAAASLPPSASGTRPFGRHVYKWPYDEVKLDRDDYPKLTWSREGAPVEIKPFGVTALSLYWWFVEQYGKAPWAPNDDDLMPPPIGSDRFAFDGEDGKQYKGFDLAPHPE